MSRDYYKVLLVSQSGKGKTYSARNLNRDTTGFVNVEDKPLPFKGGFKNHERPKTMNEAKLALKKFADDPSINVIFFDSLSAYLDIILNEARTTKKGYDVWNFYAEEVGKFLNFIKTIQKEVFITAHYEWIQDEAGAKERRVKTQGKAWEGWLEKEFTIVLFADRKVDNLTKSADAWFDLALDNSSSKCPPDIFGENIFRIPNDCNFVLEKIIEFTK